ncbi:MCE family protein [Mycolicibacterium boenickei]|uniref:MCE family protein n=1 Tax=Mycolicibacterium boenickei TaxID=146017 RepID=A0AAX2ZU05_9MYCO|nr:MlaD family protein [Mycolicibacterium boenickei]PEG61077.1 MCE family protein [Mycolicibacterium boenickei]UNB98922.1 MCE family protein [Mycolicibacterium boenickei]BBX88501.1 Mce family protein Mce4C [Mycolicibacterium boenickei]
MFLVKLIDLFVGAVIFLFVKDQRKHNPSIPLALGMIGTITLVAIMVVSIGIPRAVYHVRTNAYVAEMANAGGLSGSDPVYVAGVPAGRVEDVALAGDRVRVSFRLDKAQVLGNRTTVTVRLRTVLGKRFLDVMPGGTVNGLDSNVIPLSRTTVPYSLDEVGRKAADTAEHVDQQPLTAMMNTLAETMPGNSTELGQALAGISAASSAFAENGDKVDEILRISRSMAEMLSHQTDSLADTAANAQYIVSSLAARRQALTDIVTNLTAIMRHLAAMYTEKQGDFSSLITGLTAVTGALKANVDKIDQTLQKMPPAIRAVTNATGNGNWADVNSPSVVMPDNLLCFLNVQRECR